MQDDNTGSLDGADSTPPWGDEENFDADRAWSLIQGLREDKERLSASALSDEQRQMLDEYELLREASKTDAERWQGRAEEAEAQVAPLAAENLRLKVALEKGLPVELASRLQGATLEEVQKDADALVALVPGTTSTGPRPNPAQGSSGSGAPSLDAQIAQARKDGNVREAIRLETQKLAHSNQ